VATKQIDKLHMTIKMDDLPLKECCCGHTYFVPRVQVRFLSKLQSPTGEAQYLVTQGGFECALCGEPLEMDVNKESQLIVP